MEGLVPHLVVPLSYGRSSASPRWLPFEELSQFNLEEVQSLNEGDTVLVIEGDLEDNNAVKIAETKEENKEGEKHPTYECNFCGLILTNRDKMKVHLEVHNSDETLSCDESFECDEGFIDKLILEEPAKEEDSNKPFTCHMCTKRFNLKSTALRHVKEVHEHTWGHYCPVCNREFARKGAVDNHMRRHTGEKPYTCKICLKNFMVRSTLTRHLKEVHERLRRHFCKVCGYGFYTRLLLRNHIRTHTDDRPYFCRACGRTFRTRVTLVYHEKLHVGELESHPTKGKRVMECSECKKKVGSLYALKNHMLIHTGEKPCSCRVCGKRFTTASDVTRHMKTHIEGKPFLCTKCGSCFKQKRNLLAHLLTDEHLRTTYASTAGSVHSCVQPAGRHLRQRHRCMSTTAATAMFTHSHAASATANFTLNTVCQFIFSATLVRNHTLVMYVAVGSVSSTSLGDINLFILSTNRLYAWCVDTRSDRGNVYYNDQEDELNKTHKVCMSFCDQENEVNKIKKVDTSFHGQKDGIDSNLVREKNKILTDNFEVNIESDKVLRDSNFTDPSLNKYQCSTCKNVFPTRYSFRNHKKYCIRCICAHCGDGFWTKSTLARHMALHTKEEGDNNLTQKAGKGDNHSTQKTGEGENHSNKKADKISKSVSSRPIYINESNRKERNVKFGMHPNTRKEHVLDLSPYAHSSKKIHKCSWCGNSYATRYNLSRHRAICKEAPKYLCVFCGNTFLNKTLLLKHIAEVHAYKVRTLEKSVEKAKITVNKTFHINTVNKKIKSYTCKICAMTFTYFATLKVHINTHNSTSLYSCDKCDRTYKHLRSLLFHKRTHAKNHLNVVCIHCNKSFKKKQHLEMHMLTHVGGEFNTCNSCGKTLGYKASLKKHHQQVHLNPDFFCDICGCGFKNKRYLIKNRTSEHTDSAKPISEFVSNSNENNKSMKTEHTVEKEEDTPLAESNDSPTTYQLTLDFTERRQKNKDGIKKKYSCDLCKKEFKRNYDLLRHRATHNSHAHLHYKYSGCIQKGEFPCDRCGRVLTRKHDLLRHKKIHFPEVGVLLSNSKIDEKIFPCEVCGRLFTKNCDFHRHKIIKHNPINSVQPANKDENSIKGSTSVETQDTGSKTCNINMASRKLTVNKSVRPQSTGPYFCQICEKFFSRKFDLKRHTKHHTQEELCRNNIPSENETKEHHKSLRVCVDGKTFYRCEVCSKHLRSHYNFVRHLRIHTGEKPFTCHICGKQFRIDALLKRHIRDVHEGIKNFPCDICGRRFANKRACTDHRRIHTGERPCVCHICGKAFKTKASLYVHNVFHKDVFPFSCSHCDKRYRRRQQLKVHLSLHTGEKPHTCSLCGRSFRLRKTLKRHATTHTNDRPFQCSICGQQFAQERYLKNHGKTHALHPNERGCFIKHLKACSNVEDNVLASLSKVSKSIQYICSICGKGLSRKFDLERHTLTHNKTLQCSKCNTTFPGKKSLLTHINTDCSHDVFVYPCPLCGRLFGRHYDMLRHKKVLHAQTQETRVDIDKLTTLVRQQQDIESARDLVFPSNSALKDHSLIHSEERSFVCHMCGKAFKSGSCLNSHMRFHERKTLYKCPHCGKEFVTRQIMHRHSRIHLVEGKTAIHARNDHRRIHTGERPCVCHLCGKAFKTKASLFVHSKFHVDVFPHKCSHCERGFRMRQQLNSHVLLHTGEKPHNCQFCSKSFRLSKTLKDHVLIHINKRSYECAECGKHFAQERYLKNHARSHRVRRALLHAPLKVSHQANVKVNDVPPLLVKTEGEEEQLKELCSHCGATFLHKSELATHITKDHSVNMFHCEMCDKILKNRKSFVVHIRAHGVSLVPHLSSTAGFKSCRVQKALSHTLMLGKDLPQTDFVCSVCLKRFKTDISLKKHESLHDALENVTGDVEVMEEKQRQKANPNVLYSCDKCGKRFGMKISFLKHMRHHTGEKPYTCHICGKQFTHTGGLYYHLKHVHAGIKNHACDICGRPFALKAALEDHRRIHTGERPFVCHFCGKSFKSKASLYIHNKIHSNSFPHSCTYCDKRFRWRQQLLAHLTTHTGEKNHICDVCGRGFGVKNDLTRHKYCHSEVKPHECTVCGISFGQRRYLRNHLKTRHDLPEPVALIVFAQNHFPSSLAFIGIYYWFMRTTRILPAASAGNILERRLPMTVPSTDILAEDPLPVTSATRLSPPEPNSASIGRHMVILKEHVLLLQK
uniref:C2H2-type domain-containing protein n=1 Tax=Timema monikensis TaxID=170555 RepID=A0A7R9EAA1_9NEOP|nr:unnamed protein product [Timema monikensis]